GNMFQRPGYDWKRLPVPVIAAIHGHCYGGGLQIALGADIRIAAPDTQMSVMEIKWGLIPDMSGTQTLRDLVRIDVAKELTFTGRIVEAEEAAQLGLVTRVAEDPKAAAMELAQTIASKSPDAIRAGKRLFNAVWHGSDVDGLALEAELQQTLIGSANQMEAVMANMQKRAPKFRDPE
ncbi:MAG: crotonase/enoyl-CoA hydratase family protein, partial [Candidatus Dadabacteria bacterium]